MATGIVLAAGASTRFGSRKQLLRVAGEAAVARVARVLKEGGCVDVLVVLGAGADAVRAALPAWVRTETNRDWEKGRTGTLKAGLRALQNPDAVVVHPIDHPAVDAGTIRQLLSAPGPIAVPTYRGQRGHPTVFRGPALAEILRLGDDQPLHDVVHRDPQRVTEVPVSDAGVVLNVDTPSDVAKLEAHFGRSARARPAA